MSEDVDIAAYFERIGFAGSIAPDLETLSALHERHPAAIPFENLTPLTGEPVRLDIHNLQQKLVFDHRGGFCLEQNLLFKGVLEDLEYEVKTYAARVRWGHPEEEERPESHVVLGVTMPGGTYLVDVGFGVATLTAPLRLRAGTEQSTPHETFRLIGGEPEWRLEIQIGEDWRPVYTFEEADRSFEELSAINDMVSAGPNFTDNITAARTGAGQRHTLRNLRLNLHRVGETSETRYLRSVAEVRDTLANTFGILLPGGDRLDTEIDRIVTRERPLIPPEAA
jgi:N-hydroxyarylamine O-acetyltransferase